MGGTAKTEFVIHVINKERFIEISNGTENIQPDQITGGHHRQYFCDRRRYCVARLSRITG